MSSSQEATALPLLHKKCFICKKKKPICFKCEHCNKILCISHKMPETHNCVYKYDKFSINHEKIEATKIIKI